MLRQTAIKFRSCRGNFAAFVLLTLALPVSCQAVPLLAVDFGTSENYVQPTFSEMAGTISQSTANATFGSYTVDLAGQGFGKAGAGNSASIGQSVRPLYR